MVELGLVATGVAIGLAVAAPIGPVNLICVRRTLRFGILSGLLSGAGAAAGDGVFAAIAAFGVTAAIDFVTHYSLILQTLGALFLIGLGARTFFSHPHLDAILPDNGSAGTARVVGTTFFLTVTNPATMLGFIAIFGGVAGYAPQSQDFGGAALLVASVMLGSALWWMGLARFASLFRMRMNDHTLELVNHVSGGLIAVFGVVVLSRVLLKLFDFL